MNKSEFNNKEKFVLEQIQATFSELFDAIQYLKTNKPMLLKSRLALACVAADAFSRYYQLMFDPNEFKDKQQNSKRFKNWANLFIFNNRNEYYKNNKSKLDSCLPNDLWDIRTSLLHFFSFPENGKFSFFPHNQDKIPVQEFKKFIVNNFPDEQKKLIDPDTFIDCIFNGFVAQRKYFLKMIKKEPKKYITKIDNLYNHLQTVGSISVKL